MSGMIPAADIELLRWAAKAAGMDYLVWSDPNDAFALSCVTVPVQHRVGGRQAWNPLANDGDALRLAVKLRLSIFFEADHVDAWIEGSHGGQYSKSEYFAAHGGDYEAAARRAVLECAAQIGSFMP